MERGPEKKIVVTPEGLAREENITKEDRIIWDFYRKLEADLLRFKDIEERERQRKSGEKLLEGKLRIRKLMRELGMEDEKS